MNDNNKVMAVINTAISREDEVELAAKLEENFPITFQVYKDVKDLFPILSNPTSNIDYVAVDLGSLYSMKNVNVFAMLDTLATLLECSESPDHKKAEIVILVGTTTPSELIKEVIGLPSVSYIGLRGGDGFSYEEIAKSLSAILAKDNTLPQQVQDALSKRRKIGKSQNTINLTPRQRQIFNLVASRGASNKVIAKMLNISESTVKLHMGALLKKYKVRNRTQLAVFAKENQPNPPVH